MREMLAPEVAFKIKKFSSPLLSLPTQRKKPTCPLEYTPGGAGRFIPLTIRRCISVLLRSENILWKEKDKKVHSSHHQLIHCQTRMPWLFVRAFSTVHSYRDHLHKIQQSKGRAQTELKISLQPGTKPRRQQDGGRNTEEGGMAKKENIREEAGGILKTKESARQVREQLCI